jgi:uncharacterized protein YndB with AHSA1/START domain
MTIALSILAGIILLVLIAAALQPAECRYERQALIAASPAVVFPYVNEPRRWLDWSPWEKVDPAMQRTYDGPAAGTGSAYAWDGNKHIGAGRMTITDSQPDERIVFRLEFLRPFKATNRAEFTFVPSGAGTYVTWRMEGRNTAMGRVLGLFLNMDKMVGGQFDQGLQTLRRLCEQRREPSAVD